MPTAKKPQVEVPRLLTYQQLEEQFGIKVATAAVMVRKRRIPFIRFGPRFVRFDIRDIERWITENRHASSGTQNEA